MSIRSKALRNYLTQVNAIGGTPEVIARAKLDYRKEYKRNWKRHKQQCKELRIGLTVQQYKLIKDKATVCGLPPTTYARNAILASIAESPPLSIDSLLAVLQSVSLAIVALTKQAGPTGELVTTLERAERILLQQIQAIQFNQT